jgi:Xaa-Pro aminopeptidase
MSELGALEKVKEDFSLEEFLRVRELTFHALDKIASLVRPGMMENDIIQLAISVLKELGATQFWHRTYVRVGANTLKRYGDPAGPNIPLGEDDIYYLDIGPVFNGYEGDAGDTYVTGIDPEMRQCKEDAKRIFERVKEYWKIHQASGQELYRFANEVAQGLGWDLNLKVDGHRLSDFPHQVYCKTKLSHIPFTPSPYLWVVEIQIRHKTRDFGAFYEDMFA